MALSSLLVLGLAASTQAWPQLHAEDDGGYSSTAARIPYAVRRNVGERGLPLEDEGSKFSLTMPIAIQGGHRKAKRGLPVDADVATPKMTLPVPQGKRDLPIENDALGSHMTLPVIHAPKPGVVRRNAVEVPLANRSDVAYYVQISIGTPPQPVYVQLDTGSFELWVNPNCDELDGSDQRFCQAVGSYQSSRSSTAVQLNTGVKSLQYGIGAANITYVKDSISLGASSGTQTMQQVQFGVAVNTEDQFAGILGIGFGQNITTRYPNFLDALQNQGVTQVKAFSLGLGAKSEQEGVLVFGGVDMSKYSGALARNPIIPAEQSPDGVPRYWINMNSLSLVPPSGRTKKYPNSTMAVFLDSGATLTLLPQTLADSIAADFGSTGADSDGFYPVACSLAGLNGTMNFEFQGVTIKVAYKELIRQISTSPPSCYLGIVANSDFVLLGDTFLRSAYVVFDLQTNNTYLAQYKNCGSSTKTITTPSDIANFNGTCGVTQSSTTQSGSGGSTSGGSSSSSGSSADAASGATHLSSPGTVRTLLGTVAVLVFASLLSC